MSLVYQFVMVMVLMNLLVGIMTNAIGKVRHWARLLAGWLAGRPGGRAGWAGSRRPQHLRSL